MKYWRGMTDNERDEVKLQVKKRNLDLDIVDVNAPDLSVFSFKVRNFIHIKYSK